MSGGQYPPAETVVVDIVCTNKGRHKRIRITKITVNPDRSGHWRAWRSFHPPTSSVLADGMPNWEEPDISPRLDGMPNEVFVMQCSRCRRVVELRPERFQLQLIPMLIQHGVSRLDISDLPF